MKRRRAGTVIDHLITFSQLLIMAAILIPVFVRARDNARRTSCQSNMKQINLALRQYAADSGGRLPVAEWVQPLKSYAKKTSTFQCPSNRSPTGASNYFFNARLLKKKLGDISKPQTLVLMGDGDGDSPLASLPSAWLTDEDSPAWRHMNGANYGFADGHIKWLKPGRMSSDFRMEKP